MPTDKDRTVLIGRTGTGKTVAGLWHLSNQDLEKPWVIFNFKNDEHIDSIANVREIGYDYIPKKRDRGLFMLRPVPGDMRRISPREPSPLETYLWKVWAREHCGIFCDEGFMVGPNDAFDTCNTQGRSKRVPMITCTQRPVWLSRFAFTEASFIQCFDLTDQRDIQTVEGFVPILWDEEKPLGDHQSFYYDVPRKALFRFNPVPPMEETLKMFDKKLHRQFVMI
jgi:hypothetical protein